MVIVAEQTACTGTALNVALGAGGLVERFEAALKFQRVVVVLESGGVAGPASGGIGRELVTHLAAVLVKQAEVRAMGKFNKRVQLGHRRGSVPVDEQGGGVAGGSWGVVYAVTFHAGAGGRDLGENCTSGRSNRYGSWWSVLGRCGDGLGGEIEPSLEKRVGMTGRLISQCEVSL
jgi:hypothetical protein